MTEGLRDLFMLYAAGDPGKGAKGAQTGRRAASMDGREFTALLEHLKLVGDEKLGVSKTFAMDSFARAKAKHNNGKDTGEMDLGGFEWAMRRICRQVCVSLCSHALMLRAALLQRDDGEQTACAGGRKFSNPPHPAALATNSLFQDVKRETDVSCQKDGSCCEGDGISAGAMRIFSRPASNFCFIFQLVNAVQVIDGTQA